MRSRLAAITSALALSGLVLVGCSAPGPLATRMQQPQSRLDRVAGVELDELDAASTRYLGEHNDRRYWVGTRDDDGGAHCLAMLDEPTRLWVLMGCGRLPLSTHWNGWSARLVPDGADTGWAVGEWDFVTSNLLVQEVPDSVSAG